MTYHIPHKYVITWQRVSIKVQLQNSCFESLAANEHSLIDTVRFCLRIHAFTTMYTRIWHFRVIAWCKAVNIHECFRTCQSHHLDFRRMAGTNGFGEYIGQGKGGV